MAQTPTQTPPQAGSNFTASDGTQLDPTAATLTRAIRQTESGGDYNVKGKSGEFGAYQWMPGNFESAAKQYGLDPSDKSPTNQDKVAYHAIKAQLDAGHTQSEVASWWNSGKYDATGNVGVNKKGVAFDTPSYVKKVQQAYLSQANPSNQSGVNTAEASTGDQPPQSLGEQALGLAGKVGDFFFPAVGDVMNDIKGSNQKTPLQQAGDVGLSALSLVPGLGEVGGLAKGAGLLAKGAEAAGLGSKVAEGGSVLGNVVKGLLKGAGFGYGTDVASNLSQGKTDAGSVLSPGLGTLTGGALGAGGEALAGAGKAYGGRMVNSLIKPRLKDLSYGKNPGRAVAEEGIVGNSLDDLAENIGTRRGQVGDVIGQIGDYLTNQGAKLNLGSALQPLADAMETAAKTNNGAVFSRLQEVKRALTEELTSGLDEQGNLTIASKGPRNLTAASYNDAQGLKKLIGDMTKWTGAPSDDKTVNSALQSVWGKISGLQKDAVEKLPNIGPDLKSYLEKLNQRYGDLTSAEAATKYREAIHGRQNLVSLGDKVLGGTGLIGGLMTGGPLGGGLGALAATGASHLLGTTAVKTRIAKALAKAGGAKGVIYNQGSKTKGLLPGILKTAATRAAASQNP